MKMKIKSSGFPSHIKTPEEQEAWAKGYFIRVYYLLSINLMLKNTWSVWALKSI
jgi:hypothetical protein